MSSIDLYADFDDELDARAGDDDDDDNRISFAGHQAGNGSGDDNQGDGPGDGEDKQEVNANIKAVRIKRKLQTLNVERLKGPRGIIAIDDFFSDIKFKGKGYEKQDLDDVMKRLEHWAHRMFPKYNFDDSLSTIERLGKKRETAHYMHKYRMDELAKDVEQEVLEGDDDNRNEGGQHNTREDEPMDEFEALIDEQIALSTVHSRTIADASFRNVSSISSSSKNDQGQSTQPSASQMFFQPTQEASQTEDTEPFHQPSQQPATQVEITEEIRARIAENKRKAMAILEQRKKEAAEKAKQEEKLRYQEITDVLFDDTDF